LKRIVIIGTALAVLVGAATAFAASGFNSYTGTLKYSPAKAGSAKSPAPVSLTETLTAQGTNGHQAAPLTDIKYTVFGIKGDGKDFPKCSASQISANYKACSKALVGTGMTNAVLVPATDPTSPGSPCNPLLNVYNGGQGKLWFFFVIQPPSHTCATLTTGASAPYEGFVSQKGPNQVVNVPLPPDVSTSAGNINGVYGSLVKQVVTFKKLTKKVHGKTVAFTSSVACKKGKRPYTFSWTATNYQGQSPSSETDTTTGSGKC